MEGLFDSDGDGISNNADEDDDGLSDLDEVIIYGTAPLSLDSDSDGLDDGEELNTLGTGPLNPDYDGDGVADADDAFPLPGRRSARRRAAKILHFSQVLPGCVLCTE